MEVLRQLSLDERAAKHGPGTIVLPVADLMRYSEFFIDAMNLGALGGIPPGSGLAIRRSGSVVENINGALHDMPDDHEWAFIMGDDHRFSHDMLVQLLEAQEDVIVPLCMRRTPPFTLVQFGEESEFFDERLGRSYPGYKPLAFDQVPDHVFEVVASGSAGMVVRRHVLDAVGYPYFESSDGVFLNEDLEFCRKVRALGFKIMCDPHAYLGHVGQMTIWPSRYEGNVVARIDHGGPPGHNEVVLGQKAPSVPAQAPDEALAVERPHGVPAT